MNEAIRFNGNFRESARSSHFGISSVIGYDMRPNLRELHQFGWTLGALGLALWGIGLLGGWWLAGHAIRPIQSISQTATRIAEGNLEDRISLDGTESELDQLGKVLNHTFDRLHSALEQQRQFTADASHELRTPLTILLSESQRMRKRNISRTEEAYQESFDLCYDAGMRMRGLVENLLLLARQDSDTSITPQNISFHELIAQCIDEQQQLAEAKALQIETDLQPCTLAGDPDALRILVNNLIGNAIQHHAGSGQVTVRCGIQEAQVYFEVKDDGPGIGEDDLPHIFDRFYRADKARSASECHSGLGLALVRAISERMHAAIKVESRLGKGSTFNILFPVANGSFLD